MSHGVLPSQIRTLDSGLASASAMTSGGGANGQLACLAIGYAGISASVVVLVSVSDISFLDVNGQCGTRRRGSAGARRLLGRGIRIEQDDHAVVVPLVEDFGRVHDAVPRRRANALVDSHFHQQILTRPASRAPATGPRWHR